MTADAHPPKHTHAHTAIEGGATLSDIAFPSLAL